MTPMRRTRSPAGQAAAPTSNPMSSRCLSHASHLRKSEAVVNTNFDLSRRAIPRAYFRGDRGDAEHSESRSASRSTRPVGFLPLALIETYLRAHEPWGRDALRPR
jgi:hypothetical protein